MPQIELSSSDEEDSDIAEPAAVPGSSPGRDAPDYHEPVQSPQKRVIQNLEAMENKFEGGYDSDGWRPGSDDEEETLNDEFEEEAFRERLAGATVEEPTANDDENEGVVAPAIEPPRHIPIDNVTIGKLTVK